MNIFGTAQYLARCIIRPPRIKYSRNDLGVNKFQYQNQAYERQDFEINNHHKMQICCSIYQLKYSTQRRPLLVFLHANSSSRLSSFSYLKDVLEYFDVLTFDFAGSGNSEGEYTTLGYNQKEDLYSVIEYITNIFLWGRSMGAVTAILFLAKYGNTRKMKNLIKGVALDSPFSSLQNLIKQLASSYIPILPDFLLNSMLESVQQKITQKLSIYPQHKYYQTFNLFKLSPINVIEQISIPAFFIVGKNDKLVDHNHTIQIYKKMRGIKQLQVLEGGHNDYRPQHVKHNIVQFFRARLQKKSKIKQSVSTIYETNKIRSQEQLMEKLLKHSATQKKIPQKQRHSMGQITSQIYSPRKQRKRIFKNQQQISSCILSQFNSSSIKQRRKIFTINS